MFYKSSVSEIQCNFYQIYAASVYIATISLLGTLSPIFQNGSATEAFSPDPSGDALVFLMDSRITLEGEQNILGRTVVIASDTTGEIVGCGPIVHHVLEGFE